MHQPNNVVPFVQEVYEQQKELILLGERVVLGTLGYDMNVHHPYKPLVEAIKKFKVAQNALAQVAWNFVNDGYDVLNIVCTWCLSMAILPFLLLTRESPMQAPNFSVLAI